MRTRTRPNRRSLLGLAALVGLVWLGSTALRTWEQGRSAEAVRQHSEFIDVTLYTTSHCPYCAKARNWLQQHQVRWRECPIETDATCAQAYAAQGSPGVPLLQVGRHWQLGFQPTALADALRAQAPEATPRSQLDKPSGASAPRP